MRYFLLSHCVTILGLALAYFWGGLHGAFIAFLLMLMEISLSFDNAVVNATVLKNLERVWRRRFLTWGMLIAVLGMRLLFPVLIVAIAAGMGVAEAAHLALTDPRAYSVHLHSAHVAVYSFGGMFLLMVFLDFLFDETKNVHWIRGMERRLAQLGKLESVEAMIALAVLLAVQALLPAEAQLHSLYSGTAGVVTYIAVRGVTALLNSRTALHAGLSGFIYLQLLDASFSLDGVLGAFAISNDLIIIMLGLGIGAMFVRSLTVYLVQKRTLEQYIYLEHGAHYGIGALAVIMLLGTVYPIPEAAAGLSGVTLVGLSLLSSLRRRKTGAT